MKIDQIIRTKRKSIALIVKRDGSLVVRAPLRATDKQILELVEQKAGWIKAKQDDARAAYAQANPKEFVSGEGFLYLGRSYPLEIVDGQGEPLVLGDGFYLARPFLNQAEAVFRSWYRKQALWVVSQRVDWYAAKNGFSYKQVKINAAQTRWGSCGPKGSLNFSWRLVMAPMQVIDYVVVHELVHLQVKNHSKDFWAKVKALMPDFKQHREWLAKNGHLLCL